MNHRKLLVLSLYIYLIKIFNIKSSNDAILYVQVDDEIYDENGNEISKTVLNNIHVTSGYYYQYSFPITFKSGEKIKYILYNGIYAFCLGGLLKFNSNYIDIPFTCESYICNNYCIWKTYYLEMYNTNEPNDILH